MRANGMPARFAAPDAQPGPDPPLANMRDGNIMTRTSGRLPLKLSAGKCYVMISILAQRFPLL